MSKKIKVVILEDDSHLRTLLAQLINNQEDMITTRTFSGGRAFINEFRQLDVDVVIMDINMPGKTGIECVSETKPIRPGIQFLMSTSFENHDYIFQALCAGATGYMLKSAKPAILLDAIRQISEGGSPMSMQIARMVVSSFRQDKQASKAINNLTTREKEIIHLLAQGLVYKEIADKLFLSTQTVRTHIRNIYEKLQVDSRTEAINKVFPRAI